MASDGVQIEVAFARADRQTIVRLSVPVGTTIRQAVQRSKIGTQFTEIDAADCAVGVFGRRVPDHYIVQSGDRVEIYRPLQMDPREARRALAAAERNLGHGRTRMRD